MSFSTATRFIANYPIRLPPTPPLHLR